MKQYSDRNENISSQNEKLKDILKSCLLKSLVYEKAIKENHPKTA